MSTNALGVTVRAPKVLVGPFISVLQESPLKKRNGYPHPMNRLGPEINGGKGKGPSRGKEISTRELERIERS